MVYQDIAYNKLMDYIILKKHPFKKSGALIMVSCPVCGREPYSAQKIPNVHKVNCFKCGKFTIVDFVRKIEPEYKDSSEEDIIKHIRDLFSLKLVTKTEESSTTKLLQMYKDNGFCLTPLCKNSTSIAQGQFGKQPIRDNVDWQKTPYIDINQWQDWLGKGLNVGMVCGLSKKTVIDIDIVSKLDKRKIYSGEASAEEIKQICYKRDRNLKRILKAFGNPEKLTMCQYSLGGMHIAFNYVEGFKKTKLSRRLYGVDIEHDGGFIVVAPSRVGNTERTWVGDKVNNISEGFKNLLLKKMKDSSPAFKKGGTAEKANLGNYEGLNFGFVDEGRSEYLIKNVGVFRNVFPVETTEKIIKILNQINCTVPIPPIGLEKTVLKSLRSYSKQDDRSLKDDVLDYLTRAHRGRTDEIEIFAFNERAKGEKKIKLAEVLVELIADDKIMRKKNEYFLVKKANWKTSLIDRAKPLNFKIPYFDSITNLKYGEQILIGAQSGSGKTTLVMNIVERLVRQAITPYLFESEVKNFMDVALARGLKESDFYYDDESDPLEVEFEKNSVIIIDWLDPSDDFTQVPKMFKRLKNQLIKSNSFLITFMQLKEDGINKNGWFSPNSCKQYPSLAVKFLLEDVNTNRKHGKFIVTKNNKPKYPETRIIPTYYDENTCEVKTILEIEADKKKLVGNQ